MKLTLSIWRFFFCVLFVSIICHPCYCQNKQLVESLLDSLQSDALTGVQRFEILRKIAHNHPNYITGLDYAQKSLDLAMTLEDPILVAKAYEEISLNERLLGNNIRSIEATLKALSIFSENQYHEAEAASLVQLGSNLISDGDYDQANYYFLKALTVYKEAGETLNYALTMINLGESYRLAAQLDSAVFWFKQALDQNTVLNDDIIACYAKGNLGMVYNTAGRLEAARSNLLSAISLCRELGDPYSTSVYLADLGHLNQKEGNFKMANKDLTESFQIAQKHGLKEQVRDISGQLVRFYEGQKQFVQALKYQRLYQVYQDSLVSKSNIREIERIKAGYEISKRENEIKLLARINSQQKYLTISLAFGSGILIVLTIVLYRSNQHKKNANRLLSEQKSIIAHREEEKAVLLRELNHRVKNNLQMISSLLNLQSDQLAGHPAEEAINEGKYRVDALSLIHQKLYSDEKHTQIALGDYVKDLVLNLFYSYNVNFNPSFTFAHVLLDIDKVVPLALIINELVTNSLKYAFSEVDNPELALSLQVNGEMLTVEIRDNGIGFGNKKSMARDGFGLKLVDSLVQQLNGSLERINANGTHWLLKIDLA